MTFEAIAREWLESQRARPATSTFEKAQWMLVDNVFPWMGALPIAEIEAPEVLATLRRIEARGANDGSSHSGADCAGVPAPSPPAVLGTTLSVTSAALWLRSSAPRALRLRIQPR